MLELLADGSRRMAKIMPSVFYVLPCYSGKPASRRASLRGTAIAGTGSVAAHHSAILKPGWRASTRDATAFASSICPSFPSAAARNMWEMLKPGLCWTDLRAAFVACSKRPAWK